MTPELYQRAGDLFHRLRILPKQERESALELACNGDSALRSEVWALLEADEDAGDAFLQSPAFEDAANLFAGAGATTPEPRIPPVVAQRYRIVSRIGAGGMGVVFQAEDLRLSRPVALKILTATIAHDAERYLRFQREGRAASQLNDPHITAIFDAGVDNGLAYIAMELVEGRTLRQILADDPKPDAATVLNVIGQVASALHAAHKAAIVHRDIKPENIIVRPDGLVKVLDFGLARMWMPKSDTANAPTLLTRPGQLAGTVQYLSPEQVLGEQSGPQSDIFSLGVVAYELATGMRPFDGPTDGAVFDAILHRRPKPPSEVRPELGTALDALILGALEKNLTARIQTAEQIKVHCVRPAEPLPPARPRPARRRLKMTGAALLAVTAMAWWFGRPPREPRVIRSFQITNNGPVHDFVTDGSRIIYAASTLGPDTPLYQMSVQGGEPVPIPRFKGMLPLDLSPDGSQLLMREVGDGNGGPQQLWVGEVAGNGIRRVADLEAQHARWSSRGDRIAYAVNRELRIARADGSKPRVVFSTGEGDVHYPNFVSGDSKIRIELILGNMNRLFEIQADGGGLRPVLPRWDGGLQSYPASSADGRFLAFAAGHNNHDWDLWVFQERPQFLPWGAPVPVRLTQGPLVVRRPRFSPDGRRIFFIGDAGHAELVQRDAKSGHWTPYLGGIDAFQLDFSRDREWITFVGPPGLSVWRKRVGGGDLLQLTKPPLNAVNPRWSPDGRKVVFYGGEAGKPSGIFMADAAGGRVTPVLTKGGGARSESEPSWSPDGKRLLYAVNHSLEVIDVGSGVVEKLPNSDGLIAPRWSPDGRYAVSADLRAHLILYEMSTHQRRVLATAGAGYPSWSPDSRYVYFLNGPCSMLYRVNVRTREVGPLAPLDGVRLASHGLGWVAVSPEGVVISARDVGTRNVYALDVDLP